ncbi:MAG: hypothetical protein ACR2JC_02360 [Chloroflexota bacterium]
MAYWDARAVRGAAGEESILFVAEGADGWVGLALSAYATTNDV